MNIKKYIKEIIGLERSSKIKGLIYHYGYNCLFLLSYIKKLYWNNENIVLYKKLTDSNYHIFRGYYDIDYLNEEKNYFLCHRVTTKSEKKNELCDIGYFDLNNDTYIKIDQTYAWCWQQGSRLRWNPLNSEEVLFNSIENDQYCTKIFNIIRKENIYTIKRPLYDITNDMRFGISINFSRLQRLRPGYGYDYLPDLTMNQNAPKNDGIYLVDIKKNKSTLLYSLYDLAIKVDLKLEFQHYINHISISPDGNHFMFFHIYKSKLTKGWNTVLYISDMLGHKLIELERVDRCSHYCWINNEELMVTCRKENGEEYYCIYNIHTLKKKFLNIEELKFDGHPVFLRKNKSFITDTYPQKYGFQSIYNFKLNSNYITKIIQVYHDFRLRGERRCDLHPSISSNEKYFSIDSTYQYKRRSTLIFKFRKDKDNG